MIQNSMVKNIVKLEGLAIFLAAIYFFYITEGAWLWFFVLFLVPDISMVGYLKDKRIGAILYNIVHNFFTAFLMIAFGLILKNLVLQHLGIILLAHVGFDRFFGYGLKYKDNFKSTHIQKL